MACIVMLRLFLFVLVEIFLQKCLLFFPGITNIYIRHVYNNIYIYKYILQISSETVIHVLLTIL